MEFINEQLLQYCEAFSQQESDLLKELNRDTHLKINHSRMLSGHLQGRLLSFLSTVLKPERILEIGTYTGYSALCLAEGLNSTGKLITIDPNEETNFFAKKYIERSAFKDRIEMICGLAQNVIPSLSEEFDLVFIDADKKNYIPYFNLVISKVRTNGLIIVDNVLWKGKVIDDQKDKDTELIHEFNKQVGKDPRVSALLLPLRDGLMILRKL